MPRYVCTNCTRVRRLKSINKEESNMTAEFSTCPICGRQYFGYPALSRTDNKTLICPDCGVAEAIAIFMNNKEDVKNEQRNNTEQRNKTE